MNQNIITYLQKNKGAFSKESLIDQLKKAGYLDRDIAEGVTYIYGSSTAIGQIAEQSSSFWDFSTPKTYVGSSEKWKDFLFGLFAPYIIGVLSGITIPVMGILAVPILVVLSLVYFFKRRRFIFYGTLTGIVTLLIIMFIVLFGIDIDQLLDFF